jgi:hypothetical protein
VPVFASFILAFALQLRKKHKKMSVSVRKTDTRYTSKIKPKIVMPEVAFGQNKIIFDQQIGLKFKE